VLRIGLFFFCVTGNKTVPENVFVVSAAVSGINAAVKTKHGGADS